MNSTVFAFSIIRTTIAPIWVRGLFWLARIIAPRLPEQLRNSRLFPLTKTEKFISYARLMGADFFLDLSVKRDKLLMIESL